ncbi:MAG: phenylacetate--CoA ligase family protein [Bacteroidetes bacterium]|nr:phenylacetate--CoA ligase family protein [Bacteroidota bacterium]
MSIVDSIYKYSPVHLQNALVSLYGLYWNRRRFGGIFNEELKKYKERENYTTKQWEDYATVQLQQVVTHAFRNVPYYTTAFKETGFDESDINKLTLADISKLPFLTKDNLRKYGTTSLLSQRKEKGGSFFSSSGTTGTPTQILFSTPMHQRWSAAYEARVRNWAGVGKNMSRGMIGGRRVIPDGDAQPPYYRYNRFEKQVYFSAYHISPDTVRDYLKGIEKYRPDYMVGYAMSNYLLARFIKEEQLIAPKMKAVITSSEKLTDEMRAVFQDVYGCKTYDGWSGVEACGLVSECEHGSMHISPDVGLIELLNKDGNPVKPGETGEVVCTGFLNYDQPLIRYKIGDYMTLATNQSCKCGREMPIIEDITGRIEDVVIGKDGREMVRFHGIFIGIKKIILGQVVQEDIDNITLNIVAEQSLTEEDKNTLKKRIYSQLGDINVEISELKEISCEANGKYRAVISKVKKEYL